MVELRTQFVIDELSPEAQALCLPKEPFGACDKLGLRRMQNDGGNSADNSVNSCMWLSFASAAVDAVADDAWKLPASAFGSLAAALRKEAEKRICGFGHNFSETQGAYASLSGRLSDCEVKRIEFGGRTLEVSGELEYPLAQAVLLGVLGAAPRNLDEHRLLNDLLAPFPWGDFAATPWDFACLEGICVPVVRGRAFALLTDALIQR